MNKLILLQMNKVESNVVCEYTHQPHCTSTTGAVSDNRYFGRGDFPHNLFPNVEHVRSSRNVSLDEEVNTTW
jgi:hypothetical protein